MFIFGAENVQSKRTRNVKPTPEYGVDLWRRFWSVFHGPRLSFLESRASSFIVYRVPPYVRLSVRLLAIDGSINAEVDGRTASDLGRSALTGAVSSQSR